MNPNPEPDSGTEFRTRFLADPSFRDGLAQDSGSALATLLRPPAAPDGARMNVPDKKDQDVRFW